MLNFEIIRLYACEDLFVCPGWVWILEAVLMLLCDYVFLCSDNTISCEGLDICALLDLICQSCLDLTFAIFSRKQFLF